MDFFLWEYLKSKVYNCNLGLLDELKENIGECSTNTSKAVIEIFAPGRNGF